ncbi:MAG TPA: class I SAM-dependent methyltransferase [Burkholderiales bacterium]|nr:class I SAM-dependent methyltransferase [Burkholderiales bacterium]
MTTLVRCAVLLLLSVAAPAHAQHAGHGFSNAERWATQFDDPARDTWQKPDAVIRALAPAPDAVIADIGAGTGYFSVRLARAVPHGKVIGVDIERDMVRYLAQRAHREGLANLSAQLGAADDPRLPVKVDLVLLVDTYHHIASREDYFRRLRSSLEPGARLAIIDFRRDSPYGPPEGMRVPRAQAERELARAGFELVATHDILPYQYFIVLRAR